MTEHYRFLISEFLNNEALLELLDLESENLIRNLDYYGYDKYLLNFLSKFNKKLEELNIEFNNIKNYLNKLKESENNETDK